MSVDLLLERGLADISDRPGADLHRAFLADLRARHIEQRAAFVGVAVKVGEFLAVLALLDQRFAFGSLDVGEAAEAGQHVAQPVAALGVFAFVDDIDADAALLRDDGRHIIGEPRFVAGRDAGAGRQERQAAHVGGEDFRNAALHGGACSRYCFVFPALRRVGKTLLAGEEEGVNKFGIGQPVPRVEDPRFITGRGRYVDDFELPHQCHGVLVLSPHAHARIKSIDTAKAKAADGVLAVLTGADIVADKLGAAGAADAGRHGRPQGLPHAAADPCHRQSALGRRARRASWSPKR